jgi:hypothetical protein
MAMRLTLSFLITVPVMPFVVGVLSLTPVLFSLSLSSLSEKEFVMLTSVITFDVHNFTNGSEESFVVEHTMDNEEIVFTQMFPRDNGMMKSVRNIRFDQMFSFDYAHKFHAPTFLLETLAVEMLDEYAHIEYVNDVREGFEPVSSDQMN